MEGQELGEEEKERERESSQLEERSRREREEGRGRGRESKRGPPRRIVAIQCIGPANHEKWAEEEEEEEEQETGRKKIMMLRTSIVQSSDISGERLLMNAHIPLENSTTRSKIVQGEEFPCIGYD